MRVLLFVTPVILWVLSASGAKILGVFQMPSYSHHQLGDVLLKELARRGHEVTVITPFPQKAPVKNLREIVLTGLKETVEKKKSNLFVQGDMNSIAKMIWLDFIGLQFTDMVLNHTNIQQLLKSNETFDMVIMENFFSEAIKGFCYHFKAHCVSLTTTGASRITNTQMGNPGPPSYIPDLFLNLSSDMNFIERAYNTFIYLFGELLSHLYTFPEQNRILHRYFPDAPHLYDLYYNTSLMLVNSHVSTNPAIPLVPNMIEIGGFHVSPPEKLPKDIQDYLDGARDGAVYFSMGSNLKSEDIPDEKLGAILKALGKLKQRVLWKWESETLPGQPPNVKLAKWLPQQDILAHPNVKVFMTHGGLLSTIETIYHGVPIVGIPVIGDQEMNVANAQIAGYGLGVPYRNLNEGLLTAALHEILNNPKYSENVKRRSKIMHDQPMKPLDNAMFWIEYILRHQGAPHLRTAALNLAWYQYLMLDIIALTSFLAIIGLIIFAFVLKKLFETPIRDDDDYDDIKKGN